MIIRKLDQSFMRHKKEGTPGYQDAFLFLCLLNNRDSWKFEFTLMIKSCYVNEIIIINANKIVK
jgi:hypothetical protein